MAGWGAVAQIGSDIASSALEAKLQVDQARDLHKRNVAAYRHRYQWSMEDMKLAGLNPILAYQGIGGGPPGGAVGSGRVGGPSQYGQLAVSARAENRMQRQQSKLIDTQRRTLGQQGQAAMWKGMRDEAEAKVIDGTREHLIDQAASAAALRRSEIPGAEAEAGFWSGAGPTGKAVEKVLRLVPGGSFRRRPKGGGVTIKNYPRR